MGVVEAVAKGETMAAANCKYRVIDGRKEHEYPFRDYSHRTRRMPSNIVKINNSDQLSWEVGDPKMDALVEHLDKIGDRAATSPAQEPGDISITIGSVTTVFDRDGVAIGAQSEPPKGQ